MSAARKGRPMTDLVRDIEARNAVIAKIEARPIHDMSRGTKGRLPISFAIKDDDGQVAVSIDQAGIVRFYDRDPYSRAGGLVHEEYDSPPMMEWLQAQVARIRACTTRAT